MFYKMVIKAKEKYTEKREVVAGTAKLDFGSYVLFICCVSTLLTFEHGWCGHCTINCKIAKINFKKCYLNKQMLMQSFLGLWNGMSCYLTERADSC